MHFGVLLLFAEANSGKPDAQLWKDEMDLGVYAEELGFDSVWVPEHHFDKAYCESPDPLTALTYLAAKTSKIKLGTGAIILPWWQGHNDAMRLAERISIIDHLSDGRLLLGLGRGLARREYEGFGVDMEESRDRFNESAEMLLQGLDTGRIAKDGEFFKQSDQAVYPTPATNFRDRTYVIAMSPPSIAASAEFGGTLMCFNYQYPIEQQAEEFDQWRAMYKEHHGTDAPPPVLLDFMYCHEDAETADAEMRHYLAPFFNAMVDHYEFDGKHFASSDKYHHYASGAEAILAAGRGAAFEGFYGLQWTGTPEKMIEQMKHRIDLIGDFSQMVLVSYGGMPVEKVNASLKLFMDKVVPAVQEYAASKNAAVSVTA